MSLVLNGVMQSPVTPLKHAFSPGHLPQPAGAARLVSHG